jgi:glycosyltransferase involved in cell wall biosynthesis
VRAYVAENALTEKIVFLNDRFPKLSINTLAALYHNAIALIYPSIFEGFGIPVLEAMASKTVVITSNISCLPEAGGNAAIYVDPFKTESILHAMQGTLNNNFDREGCLQKGLLQAQQFKATQCAEAVMNTYTSL